MAALPPSTHRYQRLCNQNDLELQLACQALALDTTTLAVNPTIGHASEAVDQFALLSPSPSPAKRTAAESPASSSASVPTRPLNLDAFAIPRIADSVLSSLTQAALATRKSRVTPQNAQNIQNTQNIPSQALKPAQAPLPKNTQRANLPPPATATTTTNETDPSPAAKPNPSLSQNTGFHTARSRLLKSKLYTNRQTQASTSNGPTAAPPRNQANNSNLLAPRTQNSNSQMPAKRARFSAPRPQQQSQREGTAPEDVDLPEVPNVDPRLVQNIMNEVLEQSPGVDWDDIAGLKFAKKCVMEAVVWPMLRPDIFTGLRGPPKGLLLFGPPGTGKTMIGRAIASRSGARFFNISASSMVSKWAGEGEKTVRALFGVARCLQPSVIFIDEIDSLLTQRSDGEQEHSRRIKTEFLVQMDGAGTSREDRVLVVGATNRPQELDEAARRRLVKRLYIPLPDLEARCSLVSRLLQKQTHSLSTEDERSVGEFCKGYSGSDMYALCAEAALGPVRDLGDSIGSVDVTAVRPVNVDDFKAAARMVRASVSSSDLDGYEEWNKSFGSFSMNN